MTAPRWLVLTWRLPATASSTPRVATWRNLQRLGAVSLTPGSAILPYSEHLLEQLEWIAEEIVQRSGDAYVLPVTELPEADEESIRRRMKRAREVEYEELQEGAEALAGRMAGTDLMTLEGSERLQLERELAALDRGLARVAGRDHFASTRRGRAERAIKQLRRYRHKEASE
jgi:hypothetical protein